MIAGTHYEIDPLLHDVDLPTREIDLIAALIIPAIPPQHREVAVRRLVVERVFPGVIYHRIHG